MYRYTLFMFFFLITANNPQAAANGGEGYGQAEADFGISINLGPKVRIWGLENFDLSESTTGSLTKPICIYSNSDNGFNVRIMTDNGFNLINDETIGAQYGVYLELKPDNNTSGGSGIWTHGLNGVSFTFELASIGLSPEMSCDSTTSNADLSILWGTLSGQTGVYSDRVTITISPL